MPFTSETAALKHNSGMRKSDVDQGFEKLDPTTDAETFKYSRRCPEEQGWRNPPREDEMYGVLGLAVYEAE